MTGSRIHRDVTGHETGQAGGSTNNKEPLNSGHPSRNRGFKVWHSFGIAILGVGMGLGVLAAPRGAGAQPQQDVGFVTSKEVQTDLPAAFAALKDSLKPKDPRLTPKLGATSPEWQARASVLISVALSLDKLGPNYAVFPNLTAAEKSRLERAKRNPRDPVAVEQAFKLANRALGKPEMAPMEQADVERLESIYRTKISTAPAAAAAGSAVAAVGGPTTTPPAVTPAPPSSGLAGVTPTLTAPSKYDLMLDEQQALASWIPPPGSEEPGPTAKQKKEAKAIADELKKELAKPEAKRNQTKLNALYDRGLKIIRDVETTALDRMSEGVGPTEETAELVRLHKLLQDKKYVGNQLADDVRQLIRDSILLGTEPRRAVSRLLISAAKKITGEETGGDAAAKPDYDTAKGQYDREQENLHSQLLSLIERSAELARSRLYDANGQPLLPTRDDLKRMEREHGKKAGEYYLTSSKVKHNDIKHVDEALAARRDAAKNYLRANRGHIAANSLASHYLALQADDIALAQLTSMWQLIQPRLASAAKSDSVLIWRAVAIATMAIADKDDSPFKRFSKPEQDYLINQRLLAMSINPTTATNEQKAEARRRIVDDHKSSPEFRYDDVIAGVFHTIRPLLPAAEKAGPSQTADLTSPFQHISMLRAELTVDRLVTLQLNADEADAATRLTTYIEQLSRVRGEIIASGVSEPDDRVQALDQWLAQAKIVQANTAATEEAKQKMASICHSIWIDLAVIRAAELLYAASTTSGVPRPSWLTDDVLKIAKDDIVKANELYRMNYQVPQTLDVGVTRHIELPANIAYKAMRILLPGLAPFEPAADYDARHDYEEPRTGVTPNAAAQAAELDALRIAWANKNDPLFASPVMATAVPGLAQLSDVLNPLTGRYDKVVPNLAREGQSMHRIDHHRKTVTNEQGVTYERDFYESVNDRRGGQLYVEMKRLDLLRSDPSTPNCLLRNYDDGELAVDFDGLQTRYDQLRLRYSTVDLNDPRQISRFMGEANAIFLAEIDQRINQLERMLAGVRYKDGAPLTKEREVIIDGRRYLQPPLSEAKNPGGIEHPTVFAIRRAQTVLTWTKQMRAQYETHKNEYLFGSNTAIDPRQTAAMLETAIVSLSQDEPDSAVNRIPKPPPVLIPEGVRVPPDLLVHRFPYQFTPILLVSGTKGQDVYVATPELTYMEISALRKPGETDEQVKQRANEMAKMLAYAAATQANGGNATAQGNAIADWLQQNVTNPSIISDPKYQEGLDHLRHGQIKEAMADLPPGLGPIITAANNSVVLEKKGNVAMYMSAGLTVRFVLENESQQFENYRAGKSSKVGFVPLELATSVWYNYIKPTARRYSGVAGTADVESTGHVGTLGVAATFGTAAPNWLGGTPLEFTVHASGGYRDCEVKSTVDVPGVGTKELKVGDSTAFLGVYGIEMRRPGWTKKGELPSSVRIESVGAGNVVSQAVGKDWDSWKTALKTTNPYLYSTVAIRPWGEATDPSVYVVKVTPQVGYFLDNWRVGVAVTPMWYANKPEARLLGFISALGVTGKAESVVRSEFNSDQRVGVYTVTGHALAEPTNWLAVAAYGGVQFDKENRTTIPIGGVNVIFTVPVGTAAPSAQGGATVRTPPAAPPLRVSRVDFNERTQKAYEQALRAAGTAAEGRLQANALLEALNAQADEPSMRWLKEDPHVQAAMSALRNQNLRGGLASLENVSAFRWLRESFGGKGG